MSLAYLSALLFSTGGMLLLDWRHKLAFFANWRRATTTLSIGLAVFIVWDILGISLGIFFNGSSPLTTGIMLGPEFPLEELFFLTFLCYFSLIIYRLLETKWPRT